MEDLESGFEEMQGVKLGYLVIKGKQMFALSQVFTDLLKNIPRTTVHKRMDHLNVKKHHCDLEELRKLKAINSIAFHAAKCTLISREDVEALYVSCKTERVLKSNKRKEKTNTSADKTCERKSHAAVKSDFWRQKVWLSLRGVPQTFSFKSKAGQDSISSNHSNLPQVYRKSFIRDFQSDSKAHSTPFKNYETTRISGSCVAFNQKHTYIRHVVDRQPLLCQSAIAAHSKHQGNADIVYKRKRKRESCARQFWLDRSSHPVLVVPKCCKPKVPGGSLSQFHHLDHGLYIDAEHFHDCCSSDTESSSISERVNNDSDFGSSFSTTSNSGSSEEEDDSLSDSSDGSTDQESSSQSDSSSVSSLVSVQSIRFRRARFSTLSTKAPLVLQPTFQYRPTQQKNTTKQGETASLHSETAGRTPKFRNVDNAVAEVGTVQKFLPFTFSDLGDKKSCSDFLQDPKTQHSASNSTKDNGLLINGNRNKAQQRNPGSANKCSQDSITHCVPDKEVTVCKTSSSNLISASNSKKEEKTSHKVPSPTKPIKIEVDESVTTSSSITEVSSAAKTQFVLKSVKIKVEDNADEYEYANQACGLNCDDVHANQSRSLKESVYCRSTERSIKNHQEPRRTLPLLDPEESECKNGTRVRKNYRAMLLGKKAESLRTSTRPVAKVDRSPCPVGKYPSNGAGACRRKSAKITTKPFSFLANFPSPPSLVIGSDGDLSPAHSLNSVRTDQLPHRSHPVWRWQLGHTVVPPPNHKIMKDCVVSRSLRLSENVLNL